MTVVSPSVSSTTLAPIQKRSICPQKFCARVPPSMRSNLHIKNAAMICAASQHPHHKPSLSVDETPTIPVEKKRQVPHTFLGGPIVKPCICSQNAQNLQRYESFLGCPLFGHMVEGSQPCVDLLRKTIRAIDSRNLLGEILR